jgi:prolipoprotein diacylglyceryltransferase
MLASIPPPPITSLHLGTLRVTVGFERRGVLRRGQLFLGYLVAYGLGRFALELLRTDTPFRLSGHSRNDWVAVVLMLGGAAGPVHLHRRADRDQALVAS